MHFKVKQIETGEIHLVWKLLDTLEGQHIWSVTWEGHHIIGQDCEWYSAPPTTEQTELWKEMLQHAYDNDKIIYSQNDLDNIILNLSDKYSITRKQEVPEAVECLCKNSLQAENCTRNCGHGDEPEVPEAVEFANWCVDLYQWSDTEEIWVDNQGEKYSTAELFQLFKTPTNAPAHPH